MALWGKILKPLVDLIIAGKALETVREIDLTIGEVPVKGTVKTRRRLV